MTILELLSTKPVRVGIVLFFAFLINILVTTRLIGSFQRRYLERNSEANERFGTVFGVIKTAISVVIWVTALLFVCQIIFDVRAEAIITATGVVGVIVSLGAQSLVKDAISGFFVLTEHQYGVGDLVTIEDFTGTVSKVTVRATTLVSFEGDTLIIPNGNITRIINHSKEDKAVFAKIKIPRTYNADKIIEKFREAAPSMTDIDGIKGAPEVLGVSEIGDFSTVILVKAVCKNGTQYAVERELLLRFMREAEIYDKNNTDK